MSSSPRTKSVFLLIVYLYISFIIIRYPLSSTPQSTQKQSSITWFFAFRIILALPKRSNTASFITWTSSSSFHLAVVSTCTSSVWIPPSTILKGSSFIIYIKWITTQSHTSLLEMFNTWWRATLFWIERFIHYLLKKSHLLSNRPAIPS